MKTKSGFTLIEIIVVLIIVGVLAAIALPNLFGNVGRSRAAEALASMSAIKTRIEGCLQAQTASNFTSTPGNCTFQPAASPNWSFAVVQGPSPTLVNINALTLGAGMGTGSISLARASGINGAWACNGTGSMGGVC